VSLQPLYAMVYIHKNQAHVPYKEMDAASPDAFVEFAKNNPALAENKIIGFLSSERARADRGEISAGTINNWVKAARLFLEMSDVQLNWKKIRRVLPRARRFFIKSRSIICLDL
jgi:hypothetical protein